MAPTWTTHRICDASHPSHDDHWTVICDLALHPAATVEPPPSGTTDVGEHELTASRYTTPRWRPEGWIVRSLIALFALHASHFALRPMASYRALELGANAAQVGIVAGAYAALGLLLAMPVGRLVDRIGETPLIVAGIALTAVVAASLAAVGNLVALGAALALLGLAQLAAIVGVQTLFGNAGKPEGRDARFGVLAVIVSSGHMVGPVVAGLLAGDDGASTTRVFVSFAIIATLATAVAMTLFIRPPTRHGHARTAAPKQQSASATVRTIFRIPSIPQALFISMTMMTSIDIMIAYLPVYGEANGIGVTTVTTLLSVRAAAAVLSRLSLVPLLKLLGRKRLLMIATLLPGLMFMTLPLTVDPVVLGILLVTAGLGLGLGQPMTTSWIAGQVPAHIRGTAIGVRLTGNKLAQLALPGLFGAVAGATGIGAVFIALGALLITGSGLLIGARLDEASL